MHRYTHTPAIARTATILAGLLLLVAAAPPAPALAAASSPADAEAIRDVIASAYIEGLHRNGSREAIRAGFHPDFVMKYLDDEGGVRSVTIEEWIGRLPAEGTPVGHEVTHEIPSVDVTDDTAVARVLVYFDGEHVFTDYMGLYRFEEGWRIVTKTFQAHR